MVVPRSFLLSMIDSPEVSKTMKSLPLESLTLNASASASSIIISNVPLSAPVASILRPLAARSMLKLSALISPTLVMLNSFMSRSPV